MTQIDLRSDCKIPKLIPRNQRLMHSSLVSRGLFPPPGLVFLRPVADSIQHIHYVLPNRRQELVAVERARDGEIQIRQPCVGVSCDPGMLVCRYGIPAETVGIGSSAVV